MRRRGHRRHPGGRSIILGRMINLVFEGVTGPGVGPLLLEIVLVLVLVVAQRTLPAVKDEAA